MWAERGSLNSIRPRVNKWHTSIQSLMEFLKRPRSGLWRSSGAFAIDAHVVTRRQRTLACDCRVPLYRVIQKTSKVVWRTTGLQERHQHTAIRDFMLRSPAKDGSDQWQQLIRAYGLKPPHL